MSVLDPAHRAESGRVEPVDSGKLVRHVTHLAVDHSDQIAKTDWCTDPKRHVATAKRDAESDIVAPITTHQATTTGTNPTNEVDKQRRLQRKARHAWATDLLAGTKRLNRTDAVALGAMAFVSALDQAARPKAAEMLGLTVEGDDYDRHATAIAAYLAEGGDPGRARRPRTIACAPFYRGVHDPRPPRGGSKQPPRDETFS